MAAKEFGDIKLVDIRGIWKDEAREFTPWLAENIARLGEALGSNLNSSRPRRLSEDIRWTSSLMTLTGTGQLSSRAS